uniref:tRNA (adenine(22)-N(1))-methyltransferase n=1 Tax=Marinobacterium profundum TaxID=1714300 RepID=UPI000A3E9A11|nr:tRNA (adenine(22)-N(1))-methyltransferase TrmK [Marinobacterium profundum]
MGITLGKRLAQIDAMVTADYAHIWDCCCDHGLLGAKLLSRHAASCIHFVDRVPALMHALEAKLQHFYPLELTQPGPQSEPEARALSPRALPHWQVHCLDAAALPLQQHSGKHLVIIAGVGGDLMMQLVAAIHKKHPATDIDFLLCPVHHQFALREQLIQLNFGLKEEALVAENQRFYEVLLVCTHAASNQDCGEISAVGQQIWQSSCSAQARTASAYLSKTIRHYLRIQRGNAVDVQSIIQAYQAVTVSPATDS